jgi:saccharopine dehydrogenase-like NADP-dependent oxidoreductase
MPKDYAEREDLWVEMTGKKNGKEKKISMICTAGTLKGWEDATCNVDTGMPISIMAQMVRNGIIKSKGSFSPELIVPSGEFFNELARRDMHVYENGKRIN